jgi:uncharacterized DUF497 family protein
MKLEWDEVKRRATLASRGLDFADCAEVFEGTTHNFPDERKDYGEPRIISVGFLRTRMVVIVYTLRGDDRRIISMRYANERERKYFDQFFRS